MKHPAKENAPKTTAALHTLGCRLNQAETAQMEAALEASGYEVVPWGEKAEICVLNTCTVTAQSEAKARQSLTAIRRNHPLSKLVVVGCFAQMAGEKLTKGGYADLVLGNGEKMNLLSHLPALLKGAAPHAVCPPIPKTPFEQPVFAGRAGRTRATLKIQDGCDFMCTFCIIPHARGRARARKLENLLEEATQQIKMGAKEIVLTGVNIGTYSLEGTTLENVVQALADLPGIERIRLSSIEPTTVEEKILEYMKDPAHPLVPYLHLPLQSGSPAVLKAMGRRHSTADYHAFARQALEKIPQLCLGSDVMVGFPGEGEKEFEETRTFLASLPFAYFHVFPYSERGNTPAVRMEEKVDPKTIKQRAQILREASQATQLKFHQNFIDQKMPVLFEKNKTPGMAQGLTPNYIRVETPSTHDLQNQIHSVHLLEPSAEKIAGVLH